MKNNYARKSRKTAKVLSKNSEKYNFKKSPIKPPTKSDPKIRLILASFTPKTLHRSTKPQR